MSTRRTSFLAALVLGLLASCARAHDHHDDEVMSEENLAKPIDTILWMHVLVQIIAWGFMFPIGMVLGLAKSKYHVPLQATTFALTIGGYVLGHSHGGRAFPSTFHGVFANILVIFIITQLSLGIYLKLHIHEKTLRPYVVPFHSVIGKLWPVLGWTQMLLGAMTLRGYCMGGHTPQCLAHYIMGSAFIGYGILLAVAMYAGAAWLRRTGHSQEWFDSWVIFLWGIVNTFTEHRGSLTSWSHKDLQHTMLGVLWWTGGGLGIFLSRGGRRSVVPAVIIMMTGWAMSAHEQAMPISTKVHAIFGVVLGSAGLARVVEICFVLGDKPTQSPNSTDESTGRRALKSFQHFPPFLLVAGGLLFMSATDEELEYVMSLEIDHVTYTLMMISLAFIIYLYAVSLINLYFISGKNGSAGGAIAIGDADSTKGYQSVPPTPTRTKRPEYPGVMHDEEAYEMNGPSGHYADEPPSPDR
ncbi:hypothetical protein DL93DRAFT_2128685 [Clavulina sp. PMI_390]|nr:hypothetical protein DL93DRAFT_2128685 [Clavulina sp. PMI_390]